METPISQGHTVFIMPQKQMAACNRLTMSEANLTELPWGMVGQKNKWRRSRCNCLNSSKRPYNILLQKKHFSFYNAFTFYSCHHSCMRAHGYHGSRFLRQMLKHPYRALYAWQSATLAVCGRDHNLLILSDRSYCSLFDMTESWTESTSSNDVR
jgi:hypothetical protein